MIGHTSDQTVMMLKHYKEAERQTHNVEPYHRPKKDAYKTIRSYEQMLTQATISNSNGPSERFNFNSHKEHFCSKNLENLTPIKLKEMLVNKIHTGRFLLCRVIHDAFYYRKTFALIQDSENEIEILTLCNFSSDYLVDSKILLPRDSILLIKEPNLKTMLSSPANFYIRVESPSDLIILSDLDKDEKYAQYLNKWTDISDPDRSLSFDELNKKGNRYFAGQVYHSAIRYYTKALNRAKEDTTVKTSDVKKTLNNRAAAFLKLGKFNRAYQDTIKSSQIENSNDTSDSVNNEKAFFRMGKAAYNMRQFNLALEAFEKCLALNFKNKEANEEIIRTKKRLAESSTGKYDMKSIIEQALVQKQPRLDLADYVSDDIEVRNINNDPNYKGVFAKNNIKANTLLVASKAASISYMNESAQNTCLTLNLFTNQLLPPSQCLNLVSLIAKLQNDPYLSKEFYKLYSGQDLTREEPIDELVIDTYRIQAILKHNSFEKDQHFSEKDPHSESRLEEDAEFDDCVMGIWIIPSYFNHTCVPNAKRIFYSDFMMIYSNKEIHKGEEIKIAYVPRDSFEKHTKMCKSFDFVCKCQLCKLDRKDPNLQKREKLIKTQNHKLQQKSIALNFNEAGVYFSVMRSLYEGKSQRDETLKFDLYYPMHFRALFLWGIGYIEQASETFIKAYNLIKYTTKEKSALNSLMTAIELYCNGEMYDKARETVKLAIDTFIGDKEDIKYTISKRFFQNKYFSQILESL